MTVHPIYIVDDDPSIQRSTRFLLDQFHRPSRSFTCGESFLREVKALDPGCILLDLKMPGCDGITLKQRLNGMGVDYPVIVITGHGDVDLAVRAMKEGAIDFLEKPVRRETLLSAIMHADERIDNHEHSLRRADDARLRLNVLTPRERDVLAGLIQGYPNKTIAYDLNISPRTVEVHRANLMNKLEARSLSDVLRIAFAAGFPEEPTKEPAAP